MASFVQGALSIDLSQVYALARGLSSQAEAIVMQGNRKAMDEAIPVAQAEVQKRMPVRTGRMRREWARRVMVSGRSIVGEAASTATTQTKGGPFPYAMFVDQGHQIVAWGHVTGRFQPGVHMFDRGAEAAEPMVAAIFDKAAGRAAARIERLG